MERLGAAKQMYEKALQVQPNDVEGLINLAQIADLQGDYQGALECYRKATETDPNAVSPHFCLALLYDRHDMFDEAAEEYQKVVKLDSTHVKALLNLGGLHTKQGQYRKAIECFQRVLEVAGDNADAYNNLGAIYEELGRFNDAVAAYEKSISINSFHEDAHFNLARLAYYQYAANPAAYKKEPIARRLQFVLSMNPKNTKVEQLLQKLQRDVAIRGNPQLLVRLEVVEAKLQDLVAGEPLCLHVLAYSSRRGLTWAVQRASSSFERAMILLPLACTTSIASLSISSQALPSFSIHSSLIFSITF